MVKVGIFVFLVFMLGLYSLGGFGPKVHVTPGQESPNYFECPSISPIHLFTVATTIDAHGLNTPGTVWPEVIGS
jgi:hypothetical protein